MIQREVDVDVSTADDMRALGRRLAALLQAGDLVLLTGELGSGKTTLAQGIGAGLQVRGPVTSPTFVIARVHPSLVDGPAMVHVDAFRLGSWEELEDLDLEETLADAVTVVEWGGGIAEGLADERLEVALTRRIGTGRIGVVEPDDALSDDLAEVRKVRIRGTGPRWARDWPERLEHPADAE